MKTRGGLSRQSLCKFFDRVPIRTYKIIFKLMNAEILLFQYFEVLFPIRASAKKISKTNRNQRANLLANHMLAHGCGNFK